MNNPIFRDVNLDGLAAYKRREGATSPLPDAGSISCIFCSNLTISDRSDRVERAYSANDESFDSLRIDYKLISHVRGRIRSLSFFDYNHALYPSDWEQVECSGCKTIVYKLMMNHIFCLGRLNLIPRKMMR